MHEPEIAEAPAKERSACSPGPSTISSTRPEKGVFQPGFRIQEVMRPPPRTIRKCRYFALTNPIIAKAVRAWLRKLSEKPIISGESLSAAKAMHFEKYSWKGFFSYSSAARSRSRLRTGESSSSLKLDRLKRACPPLPAFSSKRLRSDTVRL